MAFIIRNADARPEDYEVLRHTFRPGHADFVYEAKYGIRDWRGGGRASARETAARVVAGSVVRPLLAEKGIEISAELVQVGEERDKARFEVLLREIKGDGDSVGGIVSCTVTGLAAGAGEPVFDKLQARLAYAVMSINGCKGFEYGTGARVRGYRGGHIKRASAQFPLRVQACSDNRQTLQGTARCVHCRESGARGGGDDGTYDCRFRAISGMRA